MPRVLIYYALDGVRQPPREFTAEKLSEASQAAVAWWKEQEEAIAGFVFLGAGAENQGATE